MHANHVTITKLVSLATTISSQETEHVLLNVELDSILSEDSVSLVTVHANPAKTYLLSVLNARTDSLEMVLDVSPAVKKDHSSIQSLRPANPAQVLARAVHPPTCVLHAPTPASFPSTDNVSAASTHVKPVQLTSQPVSPV